MRSRSRRGNPPGVAGVRFCGKLRSLETRSTTSPGFSRTDRRGRRDDRAGNPPHERGGCAPLRRRGRARARQGRGLRHRRHPARQVRRPRQVLLGAREGLRLLRRDRRLGFERPALRQRQVHRLAHGLSGRSRAHPARHRPACCRSRTACRSSCASSPRRPRRSARAGSLRRVLAKAAGHGLLGPRRRSNTSSSSSTRRPNSVREKGYRDLKPMTPGFFGYSVLRSSRPCRVLPRAPRHLPGDGHGARGPAHRDRAGRARSRDRRRRGARAPPTRRRCSRPSPRCWRSAAA